MSVLIALLLALGLVALVAVYFYNNLISLKVHVNEGWSDILVQLKRRHDLIGNLVETAKGYAKHEAGTLEKVVEARNAAKTAESGDMKAIMAAEKDLSSAMRGINFSALAESYPDLKANANFLQLQSELSDTENKVAASRRFYNTTVTSLNTAVEQFPSKLFAGMAGATKQEFFDLGEDEKAAVEEAPKVKF